MLARISRSISTLRERTNMSKGSRQGRHMVVAAGPTRRVSATLRMCAAERPLEVLS